jgi:hypothetical protein
VHAAGFFTQEVSRDLDNDGIDLTVFSPSSAGTTSASRLDMQVKATASRLLGNQIAHDLDVKNYDELRVDQQVPRILVVVNLPKQHSHWCKCSDRQLVLRRCGWWRTLLGAPPTTNSSSVRIQIPRVNRLDPAAISAIMNRIQQGGTP